MDAINEISAWIQTLGLKEKEGNKYASALCEDGYDSIKAIAKLDAAMFKGFGIKKGHATLILSEAQEASAGDDDDGQVENESQAEVNTGEELDDDEFFSRGKTEKSQKKDKKPKKIGDKKQSKGSRTGQGSSCRR